MEDDKKIIEPLFERAEAYGKTSYELIKLKTLDKTANVMSIFVSKGIVVLVFYMFLALLNIGAALWLGELFGKLYYGFFCIAGFYAIILGMIHFFLKNWIRKVAGDSIILQMLN